MIEVSNLSKQYRITKRKPGLGGAIQGLFKREYIEKNAVDNISFKINQGETVAYIGSNGAGKSTTIKMLTGIITPTSGEINVNGITPYKERKKNAKNIGAVFGQRTQLFWDIPVRESYDLLKHIYSIPEGVFKDTIELFMEVLHLEPLLEIPVRQLSLGQKMRCELAAAFLHNPSIVYLDEPTIGLDIAVKTRIREFIKEMNRLLNTTVILTTHDIQDIEEICNRLIIIDQGKIIYDGGLETIKSYFNHKRVIHFEFEQIHKFSLPQKLQNLCNIVNDERCNSGKVSLSFSNNSITAVDVISAVIEEYQIRDLTIADPSIENIVKEIYEKGL